MIVIGMVVFSESGDTSTSIMSSLTARAGPKMRTDRDVKCRKSSSVLCLTWVVLSKRARPIVVVVRHAFAKISSRPHFIARKPIPVRDGRFRLAVRIRTLLLSPSRLSVPSS